MLYRRYIVTKSFTLPNNRFIGRGTVFDFRFMGKNYSFLDSLESYLSVTKCLNSNNRFFLFIFDKKNRNNSFSITQELFFDYLNQKIFLKVKEGEVN